MHTLCAHGHRRGMAAEGSARDRSTHCWAQIFLVDRFAKSSYPCRAICAGERSLLDPWVATLVACRLLTSPIEKFTHCFCSAPCPPLVITIGGRGSHLAHTPEPAMLQHV